MADGLAYSSERTKDSQNQDYEVPRDFIFEELEIATYQFRYRIGSPSSNVYKGFLQKNRKCADLAVRRLDLPSSLPAAMIEEKERQYVAEKDLLSQVVHENIIRLVGYCAMESWPLNEPKPELERLLVYEYMPTSLREHLYESGSWSMDWGARLKVALGVARGVAYLHGLYPKVLHRDINPWTILLDDWHNAKISGFRFATYHSRDQEGIIHRNAVGTSGYIAPEYEDEGKLTEECDIYSFGVVLLELLTGQEPVQKVVDVQMHIRQRIDLFLELRPGNWELIVKSFIKPNNIPGSISNFHKFRLLELAVSCVSLTPERRPNASEIYSMLDQMVTQELESNRACPSNQKMTRELEANRAHPSSSDVSAILEDFRFEELDSATNKFKESLGRGHFAVVYKGSLKQNGKDVYVAVKRLTRGPGLPFRPIKVRQYKAEKEFLSRAVHENIIRLIGYCVKESHKEPERLLVYEYMPATLLDCLWAPTSMNWMTRVRIALGLARGLAYLHGLSPPILHRDIKPGNILLDNRDNPKIADFGLAIYHSEKGSYIRTSGTPGYIAPEYDANRGKLTAKCDIYSFGVVLLRLLTCERALNEKKQHLAERVRSALVSKQNDWRWCAKKFIRKGILGSLSRDHKVKLMKLALACVEKRPEERPDASEICDRLYQIMLQASEANRGNPDSSGGSAGGSGSSGGLAKDKKDETDLLEIVVM